MIACQICESTLKDYETPMDGDPIACFDCLTDYELPIALGLVSVKRYGEKLSTAQA